MPGGAALLGSAGVSHIGRARRELCPADFTLLCRAAHLPTKTDISVGVQHKRVVCAVVDLLLSKQERGLDRLLHNLRCVRDRASSASSATEAIADKPFVHLTFLHMWDETKVRTGAKPKAGQRRARLSTIGHSLVQRGLVRCTSLKGCGLQEAAFEEPWLVPPLRVEGTAAKQLLASLGRGMPQAISLWDPESLAKTAASTTSLTLLPLSDKASSNVLVFKVWANCISELGEETRKKFLYFPDTCGVHSGVRGKLVLKALKHHTMRLFSASNLFRQHHIRSKMLCAMESLIVKLRPERRLCKPPADIADLRSFVEVVFDTGAGHHQRATGQTGGKSRQLQDLEELCAIVNGDMAAKKWTHWCYDPSSGQPCCKSSAHMLERITTACANALFAQGDPIPAESRWTYLLSNMRKALLRKAVFGIGVNSFEAPRGTGDAELVDIDSEALGGGVGEAADGVRARRLAEYYGNDANFHELAIFTVIVGVYDKYLIYPMMGDPGSTSAASSQRGKLDDLLDPSKSLIAQCLAELLSLMRTWLAGGRSRKPWCVLEFVKAPADQEGFARFARAQILRISAAAFRRFEVKYSAWPFLLYPLIQVGNEEGQRLAAAQGLLGALPDELDCYSASLKRLYPSVAGLLSSTCRATIRADFASHGYSTDLIERLHAEVSSKIPRRALAVAFANISRTSVLQQAATLHVKRGGCHPLKPMPLQGTPLQERVIIPKLLQDLGAGGEQPRPALADPEHDEQPPRSSHVVSAVALPGEMAREALDIALADGPLSGLAVVERPFVDCIASRHKATGPAGPPRARKQGLNPFLFERNKHVAAARQSKGRSLTPAELQQVHSDFQVFWDGLEDRSVFLDNYKEWLLQVGHAAQEEQVAEPYRSTWAGGCLTTPASSAEFHQYHKEKGWPTNDEVYDKGNKFVTEALGGVDWESAAGFQLWGAGNRPRNVSRQRVRSQAQFGIIERGLVRVLESLPKEQVENGDLLLMVEGPKVAQPHTHRRYLAMVSGIQYNPKVFEVVRLDFDDPACESATPLLLPAQCTLRARACRVAAAAQCLDMQTSDEFIFELTEALQRMTVAIAEHVSVLEGGTLMRLEIVALDNKGSLWEPGMKTPLGVAGKGKQRQPPSATQALFAQMQVGDPFDLAATSERRSVKTKPSTSARASRGRKRTVGGDEVMPDGEGITSAVPAREDGALSDGEAHDGGATGAPQGANPPTWWDDAPHLGDGASADELSDWLDDVIEEVEAQGVGGHPAVGGEPTAFCAGDALVGDLAPDRGERGDDLEEEAAAFAVAAAAAGVSDEGVCDPLQVEEEGVEPPSAAGEPAAGSSGDGAAPPPVPQPWEEMVGPSPLGGYVYYQGRSVLRIQRDKPKGKCTVTCYRHRRCHFLLNLNRTPTDLDLFKWLFELPPTESSATDEEKKALTARHMGNARAKWSAPLQR